MTPGEKEYLLKFAARLSDGLAAALGKNCEVVVHDLSSPERSVVAIANGHLTGRKTGDTLDVLGFQLLKNPPKTDLFAYRTRSKDGREMNSSTVFLRDEEDNIFGALCINSDVSAILKMQELCQQALGLEIEASAEPLEIGGPTSHINEEFEHSVEEVLQKMIENAIASVGKEIPELTREDKIAVVAYLDQRGAFLIRYSVERLAELLNMTKFTIYNYLEEVKKRHEQSDENNTAKHA